MARFANSAVVCLALTLGACASHPPQESSPQPDVPAARPAAAATPPAKPPAQPPTAVPSTVTALDATRLPPFDGLSTVLAQPSAVKTIDRTVPPTDLWQRLRQGFAIPDIEGPLVREKMAYYMARPDYLQRVFDRSRLYLYHIVEELEKRGMPTELALLPMVESAFNPMAYSRAHASGLWQFIPGTGKRWELQQNWWYDGRRDIVDSTNAALDYLAYLYEMHGDWQL